MTTQFPHWTIYARPDGSGRERGPPTSRGRGEGSSIPFRYWVGKRDLSRERQRHRQGGREYGAPLDGARVRLDHVWNHDGVGGERYRRGVTHSVTPLDLYNLHSF